MLFRKIYFLTLCFVAVSQPLFLQLTVQLPDVMFGYQIPHFKKYDILIVTKPILLLLTYEKKEVVIYLLTRLRFMSIIRYITKRVFTNSRERRA